METQTPPPPGWGEDELTEFFDVARWNQWATFRNKQGASQKLIDIDAQFVKVAKEWLNPDSEIGAMLFFRCLSAFRVAAGLAMAAQAVETSVQCRAMLENAAYAVHIYRHPSLGTVWLNRHQDDASVKAQKEAFWQGKVVESVKSANVHAGKRFEDLYQLTIDSGAHPNERSVTGNMKIVEESDRRTMLAILQHVDGLPLNLALKTVARCGLVSLEMLQIVFNARFELLGINAAILKLRRGL